MTPVDSLHPPAGLRPAPKALPLMPRKDPRPRISSGRLRPPAVTSSSSCSPPQFRDCAPHLICSGVEEVSRPVLGICRCKTGSPGLLGGWLRSCAAQSRRGHAARCNRRRRRLKQLLDCRDPDRSGHDPALLGLPPDDHGRELADPQDAGEFQIPAHVQMYEHAFLAEPGDQEPDLPARPAPRRTCQHDQRPPGLDRVQPALRIIVGRPRLLSLDRPARTPGSRGPEVPAG